ncbi:Oidioi.mRNA.OKI2018_I69.chr1.g2915.t1.cds [Oikopleura dioica]|uniref:Oidioi.mRNA.OKI2018_I69.chr1.g2915.t1.cds n=1 Tax=Oikopleura dioica TaxID=34765 RepID=A0ABN7SSL1_OIKDI|nr:Oidioi.mRNA.OKI2018_I69.chr1.g2915.t1.cds [Oikopleura dioica]
MTDFLHEDLRAEPTQEVPFETLKPDKLKAKVRQGLPLAVKEKEKFYKRVILQGKPLLGVEFESIDNALNEVWNCTKFDRRLFRFEWLSESGQQLVGEVMARIHRSQPQITFCPLIGIVVGVLVTFIDDRGKIWQMIEHLIQSESCPIARSSTQADADDLTIRDLGLLKLKGKLKPWLLQISSSAINWRFFLCSLSYESCVRFVDCLLLEGAKVKFRFALAFLNFCSSQGRCVIIDGSPDEIDDDLILQMIEDNPSDVEKILKKGFDIRNLQMAIVKQLVNRHKMLLDLRADGLEAQMSRLSQKHAGEFYAQAKHASSSLISINSMSRLFAILPPRFSVQNLEKIFSTTTDGYAYQTALRKLADEPACVILMKTDFSPDVSIGAVLCGMKSPKTGLIGNGESFVFRVECEVESWFWHSEMPTQFAHFSPGNLNIGNGALTINDDLKNCSTCSSEVFSSPNLLSRDGSFNRFQVIQMEIFAFSSFESI